MQTVKLFENNAYLTTCKAKVVEIKEIKGKKGVILDQTVFYPTGGGQPNDLGKINDVNVIDVETVDDEIIHYIDGDLQIGEEVECMIDLDRRFDHMQQHSGEHIISGVLCQLYDCDNIGFHLGKEEIVIDYNTILNQEQIERAEKMANQAIYDNVPVHIFILDQDIDYRSKKELTGDIRIVEFGKYDRCACCGTHINNAGEVGMILVTGFEIIKKGTRIHLLCGKRAYQYIHMMMEDEKRVSALVSKPIGKNAQGVDKLLKDIEELKIEVSGYKKDYITSILNQLTEDVVFYKDDKLDASSAKLLFSQLDDKKEVFLLYNGMFMYSSEDVNVLLSALRKQYAVKGGGKKNFAQGKIEATIEQIIAVKEGL